MLHHRYLALAGITLIIFFFHWQPHHDNTGFKSLLYTEKGTPIAAANSTLGVS